MADERLFDTIRKGVPGTEMPRSVADRRLGRRHPAADRRICKSIGSVAPAERPIGNVENGERLFAPAVRVVSPRGGTRRTARPGPDPHRRRSVRSAALMREIRTPSEWIPPTFETVTIVTKDGQRIRGAKKNEDVFTIQIMDTRERIQGYRKSDLQEVIYEKTSLMPAYPSGRLNDSDLTDLVGYLGSLRGADRAVASATVASRASCADHEPRICSTG